MLVLTNLICVDIHPFTKISDDNLGIYLYFTVGLESAKVEIKKIVEFKIDWERIFGKKEGKLVLIQNQVF